MGARGEVRGKEDSVVLLLKNMVNNSCCTFFPESLLFCTALICLPKVGPDEVDEELHDEIQQECGKYGKVENVVIYQVWNATCCKHNWRKNTCRRSKMTLTTLKCMSKFLSNSMRVLRQRRQRMDLTGGTYLLFFFCESLHLSFQIFWRPDSFGPDLRSRDVRPARFFSISNLLWASRNFLRFKSDPKVLKSKRSCSKQKWLAQRPRSMFSHFGHRLIIYMKVTSSCVSLRNTIQMWIHKVNENIE